MKIVEDKIYREGMGNSCALDMYYPDENSNGLLLFYFHGGGIEGGDKVDQKGLYAEWVSMGYSVISANYRMYPDAVFPDFVEDAANAVAYGLSLAKEYFDYKKVVVGGISAGAYLSMMLHFHPGYLKKYGVDEQVIDGYLFDAGQPTTHYNVLRERGEDTGCVCIDEAAPLYYLRGKREDVSGRQFLVMCSSQDIPGRREQNELMMRTMETHGYAPESITYRIMEGYEHASYVDVQDDCGHYPYATIMDSFMRKLLQ